MRLIISSNVETANKFLRIYGTETIVNSNVKMSYEIENKHLALINYVENIHRK